MIFFKCLIFFRNYNLQGMLQGNVAHMDRFSEEFGTGGVERDDQATDGSPESQKGAKPVDFQTLFGGNNNDHFMMGMKFTK